MKISSLFKSELRKRIEAPYAMLRKRRPIKLDIDEAIDCLFRLVRTGMQWREVEITSVTYSSLFKHVQRWVDGNIMQDAYSAILNKYASKCDGKYYIVDLSHVNGMSIKEPR